MTDFDPRSHKPSLHQAVGHALRANGPTRVRHDDGDTLAEIYINRGFVIHAHVNGLGGVPAIAAMIHEPLSFEIEYDVWPAQCTLMATWEALCHEAERLRARADTRVELRDDDSTVPLDH
ncbi:MAG TPA: hypothetical protein VG755_41955 [Nannocystaceae bacterium]|nr:hypothetical protein [Nannocystaceae bacterium]